MIQPWYYYFIIIILGIYVKLITTIYSKTVAADVPLPE